MGAKTWLFLWSVLTLASLAASEPSQLVSVSAKPVRFASKYADARSERRADAGSLAPIAAWRRNLQNLERLVAQVGLSLSPPSKPVIEVL
jgi:hypothetical protein